MGASSISRLCRPKPPGKYPNPALPRAPHDRYPALFEDRSQTYAKANNKPSTVASKAGDFQRYLEPALGHLALDEIRPLDVEKLKTELLESGLHPKTINNALGTLRKALHYAEEMEIIGRVLRIRPLPVPEREVDYLTPEELDRLLVAANSINVEWHDMIFFAARTGLRYGELCELRWGDVDLDSGTLRVKRSFTRGDVTDRKNRRAVTLPLSPATHALLKARRHLRHLKGNGLVFAKPDGGRHIHRRADVALKRCCRRAGLREIGWHKLRHTFATHLLSRGRELFEVKELLGQRDINSTLVYAHLMPQTKREAVAVLDEPPSALRQHSGNE